MLLVFSCKSKKTEDDSQADKKDTTSKTSNSNNEAWKDIEAAIVKINSYDRDRILETGQGFFIGENLIVTKYSILSEATKVMVSPFNTSENYVAEKYVAFDRINDLIILQVEGVTRKPIELYNGTVPNSAKTMYINPGSSKTIQLFTGKVLNLTVDKGTKLYRITNRVRKSAFGMPIFVSNKKSIGLAFSGTSMYQSQSYVIPSFFIAGLLKSQKAPQTLESLRSFSNAKVAAENMKIKGLVLETEAGDITIKLFNETPAYRDNFIKLAKEGFYDSLLIHRVIRDFGIQSGAADTRYAEKGDII